jgi:hypothetical protein
VRIKNERDFWSGLMFVVLGVAFAVFATHDAMGAPCAAEDPCAATLLARLAQLSADPGAGYFPLALGLLLALLGAFVLFKSLTIESEGGEPIGNFAWRPLLALVVAVALFGATVGRTGLALGVPILVVVCSLGADAFRWKAVLANAIVLSFVAGALFVWALQLRIPMWPALAG